jgi:hypothetical protein
LIFIFQFKYLLPSHLVISVLQVYLAIDYEQLELEKYSRLQELSFKTINTIITRYSKKFSKLTALICNLLMKLISKTTNLSSQNDLREDQTELAVKLAQDMERLFLVFFIFNKFQIAYKIKFYFT